MKKLEVLFRAMTEKNQGTLTDADWKEIWEDQTIKDLALLCKSYAHHIATETLSLAAIGQPTKEQERLKNVPIIML